MVPYGGFWWRVLAYVIDGIVLNVIMAVWGAVVGVSMFPMAMTGSDFAEPNISGAMLALTWVFSFLLNWLYFALMEASKLQATLGKLVIGLVVTDQHGDRISFLRATGRYFAKIISGLILFIGFIMVAVTQRKQGLHDILASTLVYKTRDPAQVHSPGEVFA